MVLEILRHRGHGLATSKSDLGSEMSILPKLTNIGLDYAKTFFSHYLTKILIISEVFTPPLDTSLSVEDATRESRPDTDSICSMGGPDVL